MNMIGKNFIATWASLGPRFMPFADVASRDLPLSRLLRLSLFQVSVGMVTVLMIGTLNRVMIVELGIAASIVALMVALPILFAPVRALVGFRSDNYRSALGWRRVPFIAMGAFLQFGGLAIMPFALLLLSGDSDAAPWVGQVGAALAFLLAGAGIQISQTAGLALATDLVEERARPRVVALMYVMLLVGMVVFGFIFGALLANFSAIRLIQVVQGAAVLAMVLNVVALWKQEARQPKRAVKDSSLGAFRSTWTTFVQKRGVKRFLVALALGTAAFNMQDIVLEPYGGEVLGMGVGQTTALTALLAGGALTAFILSARALARGFDPFRLAGYAAVTGLPAFVAVILAAPLQSPLLFCCGTALIGFGGGLFSVATLTAAMGLEDSEHTGLALGAWGAVQATSAGISMALGGGIRDLFGAMATAGQFGEALNSVATGYGAVYHVELFLLVAALVAIGPLASLARKPVAPNTKFGMVELPG